MDPTTAVTVAASKELAKKADSYLGLLIKPVLTTIGQEWDTRLKEKFSAARSEKQAQNLQHHIAAGEKIAATRSPKKRGRTKRAAELEASPDEQTAQSSPSVKAIDGLEKWIEGARDVGPEDQTAPIWQNLFADLLNHEDVDALVIETLHQMKAVELRMLLRLKVRSYKIRISDYGCEQSLKEKGLVIKRIHERFGCLLTAGAMALLSLFLDVILVGRITNRTNSTDILNISDIVILIVITVIGIFLIFFGVLFYLNSFSISVLRPTWLGQEIIRRAIEAGVKPDEDD